MKRLLAFVPVLATGAVIGAGCNALPYAAVVDGTTISQSDFNSQLAQVRNDPTFVQTVESQGSKVFGEGSQTFSSSFTAGLLTQDVTQQIIHKEAARRGVTITATDLQLATDDVTGGSQQAAAQLASLPPFYRDQVVETSAEQTAIAGRIAGVDVGPSAVRAYYDSHPGQFAESCVSIIQTASQADATRARQMIASGATFSEVARSSSTDSTTASNGGAAGCAPRGTFVSSFEQTVDALQVGEVSQPIQVQGSWLLLQVTSRPPQPFDTAVQAIRSQLLGSHAARVNAVLRALQARADVTVSPQYCQRWGSNGCVAPKPPSAKALAGAKLGQ